MKGWRGEERVEGKKGRMSRCLVRQCCLFFSCCVRPVSDLSFPFTTTKSSYRWSASTRTTWSFMFCHTHSVWQSGEVGFFFAPPANGLHNLSFHWRCSRGKEKVTAEAEKANRVKCISWQEGALSLSPPLNGTDGCSYIPNCIAP